MVNVKSKGSESAARQKWARRSSKEIERDRNISTVQNLIRSGQTEIAKTLASTFGLKPDDYAIGRRGRPSSGPRVNVETLSEGDRATWARAAKVLADAARHGADGPQGLAQRLERMRKRVVALELMTKHFPAAKVWAEMIGKKLGGEDLGKDGARELARTYEAFEIFWKASQGE